jgi:hypothetical protein
MSTSILDSVNSLYSATHLYSKSRYTKVSLYTKLYIFTRSPSFLNVGRRHILPRYSSSPQIRTIMRFAGKLIPARTRQYMWIRAHHVTPSDIAVNLTDPQFQGRYHGRQKHNPDLPSILQRAKDAGVQRILITGTSLEESKAALELAKQYGAVTFSSHISHGPS